MTLLHGTATTLRPVRAGDAEALAAILAHPDIARWWPGYDLARVRSDIVGSTDTTVFVITPTDTDEVTGSIQYVEEPAPDYRHASIDVFLDPAWQARGLATDAVRTLARHLFHDRGHHRLAIQPAAANERAIRTFTRVGFRPVGVMRRYERDVHGQWQDCLLMELLKSELT